MLLVRTGGGHAARLSIPRDTVVDIPGHGMAKINAAYALGGAALAIETVKQYLGIPINHVVEVNFDNFPHLIDAMGGVDYTGGCVVSNINGGTRNGGYTLRLKAGTTHINGKQALALARTRHNACHAGESDLIRVQRQQQLVQAMKSRLLSFNGFIRLPWISWNTPPALKSDMGGTTLLGLFGGLAIGGTPGTRFLHPSGTTTLPDGSVGLVVSDAERRSEVQQFQSG
jgi:LCP family protein required for cell wall assembly